MARRLGLNKDTVASSIRRLKAKAAAAQRQDAIAPKGKPGFAVREVTTAYGPEGEPTGSWLREGPAPVSQPGGEDAGPARDGHDGYFIKGVSTLFGPGGEQRAQWVKTSRDAAFAAARLEAFVQHLSTRVPAAPLMAAPEHVDEDLLAVYPMGDPHFGMYAWAEEAGEDFDLETAREVTYQAIDRLVAAAPPAKQALLLNLGDFFHGDNSKNQTPESGNVLDIDTRHAKVFDVGVDAMVHCIERLKEKHAIVHAWMMRGNHDVETSVALAACIAAYFRNDPRVIIDRTPSLYQYLRFGNTLIGSHHGHGAKFSELPGIMATDMPEDWGETIFRTWYCGHIHHKQMDKEHPGCMVETFNTLAPGDAWHAGKGYRAARNMQCIVHHRKDGEVQRHMHNVPRSRRRRAILVG